MDSLAKAVSRSVSITPDSAAGVISARAYSAIARVCTTVKDFVVCMIETQVSENGIA